MKVKVTAIRTAGFGCIKGESSIYEAEQIIDKGTYYCIVTNSNPLSPSEVRARKENFSLEIITEDYRPTFTTNPYTGITYYHGN